MGKKKGKDKGSMEEDDFDLTAPPCTHIRKGIDHSFLKKPGVCSNWTTCQDCKGEDATTTTVLLGFEEGEEESASIWMCLKCGYRGCGRNSEKQHAIKHYETPRSDPHCLVVSMDNWSVWCYICDEHVEYSPAGCLAQLLANIKKQTMSEPSRKTRQRRVKVDNGLLEEEQKTTYVKQEDGVDKAKPESVKKSVRKDGSEKSQKFRTTESSSGVSVKGLSNLGNTCFFNAVVQNLSQTQLLRQILDDVAKEKANVKIIPGATSNLDPIEVHLGKPGSLTLAMLQLLNEIHNSKKGVVTPRELFTQVCKKAARFKGFQQQDSQELLRYLLDGMRAEEIKRVSAGILEAFNTSGKHTSGEQSKSLLKEYEKNGFPKNFVDQVFGGELTSTVMCQQCKTVSLVTEMFLDLSLPVSDEVYRKNHVKKGFQKTSESSQEGSTSPALTNGSDDVPSGAGSKYQQKKAKKQAKKQAKNQRRQQKVERKATVVSPSSASPTHRTETQHADASNETASEDAPAEQSDALQPAKEDQDEDAGGDSAATLMATNRFSALSEECHVTDSVLVDENSSDVDREGDREEDGEVSREEDREVSREEDREEDGEVSREEDGEVSREEDLEVSREEDREVDREEDREEDREVDREEDREVDREVDREEDREVDWEGDREEDGELDLAGDMEGMSLNDAFLEDCANESMERESAAEAAKEYTVVSQDPELAFCTLAAREAPGKQECSVQSCLFQFTEVENLTHNNSLLCVTCAKRLPVKGKAEGTKKNVYTDAVKQMLISSAPPVLTLHLKRFQQLNYSICKVNRHVQFPQILDLAPFCAVKCKNVSEGETRVLYSLYGIVEHSGTMRSGHYTAYVKARAHCSTATTNGPTDCGNVEPPKGSWYHISDTSLQPVTESKVQGSQAYLLFYEKI